MAPSRIQGLPVGQTLRFRLNWEKRRWGLEDTPAPEANGRVREKPRGLRTKKLFYRRGSHPYREVNICIYTFFYQFDNKIIAHCFSLTIIRVWQKQTEGGCHSVKRSLITEAPVKRKVKNSKPSTVKSKPSVILLPYGRCLRHSRVSGKLRFFLVDTLLSSQAHRTL